LWGILPPFIHPKKHKPMQNICLSCQHIAHEDDFTENMGCCPMCNDETIVELEETEE